MPFYENVFIARQDISAPQMEILTDDFSKIIEDQGGKIAKREYWGLRGLAYRIKKNRKAHYVLLNIDASAQAVQEMERLMLINEDVLRYLTVKVDELEEGPSAVMQSRSGRDERSDRFGRDERPRRSHDDDGERPRRPRAKKDEAFEAGKDKKDEAVEAKDDGQPEDAPDKTTDKTGDDA